MIEQLARGHAIDCKGDSIGGWIRPESSLARFIQVLSDDYEFGL